MNQELYFAKASMAMDIRFAYAGIDANGLRRQLDERFAHGLAVLETESGIAELLLTPDEEGELQ